MQRFDFTVPEPPADQDTAKGQFLKAQELYYQRLFDLGIPGTAWFRHQIREARLARGDEELEAIEGVGPRIAESLVEWFSRPANQALIEKFRRAGVTLEVTGQPVKDSASQSLVGLTFVITGTLPTWSRNEAKAFIEQHGGKVTGSVSQKTNYLILGENARRLLGV